MRILVINWQDRKHPYAGGAEVHLHEIFSRLGARGHRITLLCCGFRNAPTQEEYDHMRVVRRGGRLLFNWGVRRWARDLMRRETYDVVVDDINKIPFYTARFIEKPLVAIVHHLFGRAIYREVNPLAASYVFLAESLVPRYYRAVPIMAVSDSTREDLISKGLKADMIRVIHNGIDLSRYRPDPLAGKSPVPMITYLGRLKRYKSIDHVFGAVTTLRSDFPTLCVQIIGSGGDERRLRRAAASLGVADRVVFNGFTELKRKLELLRQSWVVVCPSFKEGWGLTNIEANACGTPIVCADVPGLRDSARDGQTGLLYPYGDIGALTDRLRRILTEHELRERLGRGALDWAGKFSWDKAADQTAHVLERVIAGDRNIGREHFRPEL